MGKSRLSGTLNLAAVYMATFIGAGFASGREIHSFFVRYGYWGMLGLIVSGAIISLVGWAVMDICIIRKIKNYEHFMTSTLGTLFGAILEAAVAIFLLVLFCTMLAAGGATVNQSLGIDNNIGIISMAVMCFVVLLFDAKGVVKINVLLAPLMIIGGMVVGIYLFIMEAGNASPIIADGRGWLKGALLYSAYNIVTGITVLCGVSEHIKDKKTARNGAFVAGTALTLLGICFALPLYVVPAAAYQEVPIMFITSGFGGIWQGFYFAILIAAIFTTAAANGFAIVNFVSCKTKISPLAIKLALTVVGVVFAQVGFSNFVNVVYPIFGYIGLFEIILILLSWAFLSKKF